jgi:uncharacterized protein (DUF1697 family)
VAKHVALLRAINVGRGRKLLMADVRAQFEAAGARDVTTYIQSGNIVFAHARPSAKLVAELEQRLAKVAGFEVPVVLRSGAEWSALIRDNPYAKADPDHLHVVVMQAKPPADALAKLDLAAFAPERCTLVGRDLYLHLPFGMGKSKLAVALGRAKPLAAATARNWRTVLKLHELAGAAS